MVSDLKTFLKKDAKVLCNILFIFFPANFALLAGFFRYQCYYLHWLRDSVSPIYGISPPPFYLPFFLLIIFFTRKVVEQVNRGSTIQRSYPVQFYIILMNVCAQRFKSEHFECTKDFAFRKSCLWVTDGQTNVEDGRQSQVNYIVVLLMYPKGH